MRAARVGSAEGAAMNGLPECSPFVAFCPARRQERRSETAPIYDNAVSLRLVRGSPSAQCGAQPRGEPPDRRRLLDVALEAPPHDRQRAGRPAAPARRGTVIEQAQALVAPFALVTL